MNNKADLRICFDECIDINGEKCFWWKDDNGLLKFGSDKVVRLYKTLPNGIRRRIRAYKSIVYTNGKYFFSPCNSRDIWIYDEGEDSWSSIAVNVDETLVKFGYLFWNATTYGKKVFLFGHGYPGIAIIDIDTYSVSYVDGWINDLRNKVCFDEKKPYLTEGDIQGKHIYLPFCSINKVLDFDMESCEAEVVEIETELAGFNGLSIVDDKWLLVSRDGADVVVYKPREHSAKTIKVEKKDMDNPYYVGFYKPIVLGGCAYLFPVCAKHVYAFDVKTEEFKIISELDDILQSERWKYTHSGDAINSPMRYGDKLFFICGANYKWYLFDPTDNSVEEIEYCIDKKLNQYYWTYDYENFSNCIVSENEKINLEKYVECIRQVN